MCPPFWAPAPLAPFEIRVILDPVGLNAFPMPNILVFDLPLGLPHVLPYLEAVDLNTSTSSPKCVYSDQSKMASSCFDMPLRGMYRWI